jgi:hypothetical protein
MVQLREIFKCYYLAMSFYIFLIAGELKARCRHSVRSITSHCYVTAAAGFVGVGIHEYNVVKIQLI